MENNQFNQYSGCKDLNQIETISPSISPIEFFEKYVSTRTPVVFQGHLTDANWKGDLWTNEYLKEKAGESILRVEWRDNASGQFGKGVERLMKFSEVLDAIANNDDHYYLTTQDLEYSPEGRPSIVASPVSELIGDFPWRPKLTGGLIPQNINIWMGSSREGTTTGLHHDFHDNIYILLRGEKDITLYSPAYFEDMYVVGKASKIHPNGRVNFEGQPTLADGSHISSMESLNASRALETAASRLASKTTEDSDVESIENDIDEALENILNAERCDDEDDYEDDDDEDDYEDDDDQDGGIEEGDEESEEENDVEDGSNDNTHEKPNPGSKRKVDNESDATSCNRNGKNARFSMTATSKDPLNFCRITSDLSELDIATRFPTFLPHYKKRLTVTLKEGQMIFIPTGWFHEVKSRGSDHRGHVAFNYWFHPPDNHDFNRPYSSDFWKYDWECRDLE